MQQYYEPLASRVRGRKVAFIGAGVSHRELIGQFVEMGADVTENDDSVTVARHGRLGRINVKTLPYPGFPTDMNPQITALLAIANGTSIMTESVFENRFRYVEELNRMGASIKIEGRSAVVDGVPALRSARVRAVDLRAGVAMIIAGLSAEGTTEIDDIYHIERGYEDIVDKLTAVGADIRRVSDVTAEGAVDAG